MLSQAAKKTLGLSLVGTCLLATSCRASVPAVPSGVSADAGPEAPPRSPERTFHHEPIETAEEDPKFTPALVATAQPDGPRDRVRFDWEAPCRVPVRHYNYRNDRGGSLMRMTLDFDLADDGYRVRLADFAFESFGGEPLDDPEIAEQVTRLQATAAATMPDFHVSLEGRFESISSIDDMVEFIVAELGSDAPPNVGQMLRHPHTRQQLTAVAGDYWKSWVELWDGLDLSPGESITQRRRLPFFGSSIDVDLEITHLGTLDAATNLRLFRAHQILEGPQAKRMMIEQLQQLAKQTASAPVPDDAITSFRRETTMYVAVDPQGAKPHRARRVMVSDVDDTRRVEVTDWAFDWSSARGCGS